VPIRSAVVVTIPRLPVVSSYVNASTVTFFSVIVVLSTGLPVFAPDLSFPAPNWSMGLFGVRRVITRSALGQSG